MSETDLTGKVAIVTGGGGGIGRAMTLGLVERGARVAVLDIDIAAAETVAADARTIGAGDAAIALSADVAIESDCVAAVDRVRTEFGGLHVLVNNGARGMVYIRETYLSDPVRFWDCDPAQWQAVMDSNVRGPFLMARQVAPHLIAQGWGRIVNVTTSFDTMMRPANMPYGQSKAALEAASASWAGDLTDTGVTVNVLVPGSGTDTPMIPADPSYDRSKLNPPDVMVAPICWLASESSDGVAGMRFRGKLWDPALPHANAAERAGAPIGWPDLAAGNIRPYDLRK